MPALIIILSIIALLALLLSLKITLRITYKDAFKISLKVLFFKKRLYPSKKKEKKYPHSMSKRKAQKIKESLQKKKKPKKEKKKKKEKELEKPDLVSMVSIITSFIKHFIKLFTGSVRIKLSRMHLTVASEDAATTAVTYGAVSQSVNILFPLINSIKNVKKLPSGKNLSVRADFLSDTPSADVDIILYVRVGGAIKAVLIAAARAFKKAVVDKIKELDRKRYIK